MTGRETGRRGMVVAALIAALALWVVRERRDRPRSVPPRVAPAERITTGLPGCTDLPACELHCSGGDSEACFELANEYVEGRHVTRDETRAAALYVSACDHGNAAACASAGRMYEFAHGVSQDTARALQFYDVGCNAGSMTCCYNQALVLSRRAGSAADRERATDLFARVCRAGSQTACAQIRADAGP